MKKLIMLLGMFLVGSIVVHADQITFSFVAFQGNSPTVAASSGGMNAGPGENIAISDTTLGEHFPLSGVFTASAGTASQFAVGPNFVFATYTAGGVNSVEIVDPSDGDILVAGTMQDNGGLLAQYPGGTGNFLGSFTVTQISPEVLGLFGLSGNFNPSGAVSFTFGQDTLTKSGVLDAVVGGGSVTVEVSPIPESSSLMLLGIGMLVIGGLRWKLSR